MLHGKDNSDQNLLHIEQLINQCHYEEALDEVETFAQQVDPQSDIHIQCILLKSIIKNYLAHFDEALQLAEQFLQVSQGRRTALQELDALIVKAEILCLQDRYKEAQKTMEQGEHLLDSIADNQSLALLKRKAAVLFRKGVIYRKFEDYDRAWEYTQQSVTLAKALDHKILLAEALLDLGVLHHFKMGHESALELYHQSLALAKETNYNTTIWRALGQLCLLYENKGDHDRGIEYGQQALSFAKKIDNTLLIAWSFLSLGNPTAEKGELNQALEYYQQALAITKELNLKEAMAWAHFGSGYSYDAKGEFEAALEHLQQCMALSEECGNKHTYGMSFEIIGSIYQKKGEWKKAITHLEKGIEHFKKTDNRFFIARSLFWLIKIEIETKQLDQANQYFQRLQQINSQLDNDIINQHYRVAEALLLKTRPRARYRVKAEEILEQVVNEEVMDHRVTTVALLNLCDLLLTELRTTEDPELLNEVQIYVIRLQEIAEQQGSFWLQAETQVLQSRLALVDLDLKQAQYLLEQAQNLAEEKDLRRLAIQISNEHDNLLDQLGQWEDLIDRNASMSERAELAQLSDLLVRMVHKRVEDIPELTEEKPELLLITGADSGLSVFSKQFQTDRSLEEHLIAGFLMAINAFVQDAFASSGSIERIKHEEHTLILQTVDPFLLCYVFQGPSYFALQKLSRFIESLQESSSIWEMLTQALQTRRFLGGEEVVEALVSEVFLAPPVT